MKILILENDPKEQAVIQQALNSSRFTLINVTSSEQAWTAIQSDVSRFVIANWDTSDVQQTQFISRVRAAKFATPVYILLLTTKSGEEELTSAQADDVLHKPFKFQEIKNRVAMAERILSLASNLATARDQLEAQALLDPLTGYMNRSAFLRQAAAELERARRASVPLSLIALDIDNFKDINDRFGNNVGDDVLRVVSQAIKEKSRPYDCIGRWMGDEFIILVAGTIASDAEKIADRIIAGVRGTRIEVKNEAPLNVKVSAGIASISRISVSADIETLIQQSRQAVARAKDVGGNQVFVSYV